MALDKKSPTLRLAMIVVVAMFGMVIALPSYAASVAPDPTLPHTYGAAPTDFSKYAVWNADLTDLPSLAAKGINFLLGLLGIIAVILIVISGWQWMVADSEDKVKEARKRLINSVIGLVIVALSWIIGYAIVNTLTTVIKP